MLEIWMTIVGISMSLGSIPQIFRIIKRKKSDDISVYQWLIVVHGITWWIYYGYTINSVSMVYANFFCLVIYLTLLFFILKYRTLNFVNSWCKL